MRLSRLCGWTVLLEESVPSTDLCKLLFVTISEIRLASDDQLSCNKVCAFVRFDAGRVVA